MARPVQRASLLGQVHDLTAHTAVVEFNDLAALARELAKGDVACVLAEPAMTNIGMVLPEPGYWPAAQALIERHGAALVFDETHTISCGPGGYARAHGLHPDALVLGKPIGGGLPCAVVWLQRRMGRTRGARQTNRAERPLRHRHHAERQPAGDGCDARDADRTDDRRHLRADAGAVRAHSPPACASALRSGAFPGA